MKVNPGQVGGGAAYLLWGLFPLYVHLLSRTSSLEIVAHRVVWSLAFSAALLSVVKGWPEVRRVLRRPRLLAALSAASLVIATNWGLFIWGATHDRVIDVSLGYFINPLVTVALGVVLLGERLHRLQMVAIVLGSAAVVIVTIGVGDPPVLALALAGSFATYGFIKKTVGVKPVAGLTIESAVLTPIALMYLATQAGRGHLSFISGGWRLSALLVGLGITTAVPLLLFGFAAVRIPLAQLGLLQYLTPIGQLLVAVVVFHENVGATRWAAFGLIWLALSAFVADALGFFTPEGRQGHRAGLRGGSTRFGALRTTARNAMTRPAKRLPRE